MAHAEARRKGKGKGKGKMRKDWVGDICKKKQWVRVGVLDYWMVFCGLFWEGLKDE